jgi:hypothetical protein
MTKLVEPLTTPSRCHPPYSGRRIGRLAWISPREALGVITGRIVDTAEIC